LGLSSGSLQLLEVESLQVCFQQQIGDAQPVTALADVEEPDCSLLFAATATGKAFAYEVSNNVQLLLSWAPFSSSFPIHSMRVFQSQQNIICGGDNGQVYIGKYAF